LELVKEVGGGGAKLLDWTTGLDYWTHPNCRKIPHTVQDRSWKYLSLQCLSWSFRGQSSNAYL